VELAASSSAARFTDSIGAARAVTIGALMIAIAGVAMVFVGASAWLAVVVLALFVGGFEFGLVSAIPFLQELQPAARSRMMGFGFGAGTVSRAVCSVPAAALYERFGISGPGIFGAFCAMVAVMAVRRT
jgi:predicted MFS family arabinose efflux permease